MCHKVPPALELGGRVADTGVLGKAVPPLAWRGLLEYLDLCYVIWERQQGSVFCSGLGVVRKREQFYDYLNFYVGGRWNEVGLTL